MGFLTNMNWRYATKKFDVSKKVQESDLQKIRDSIRLAPTAFGVQMFKVLEVVNPDVRKLLQASSYGQPQVVDASNFFIFCARADAEAHINNLFIKMSGGDEKIRKENLGGYEEMVRASVLSRSKEQLFTWSQKNTGIALGFALAACAELKIDACPMDGFDPAAIKQILNLSDDFLPIAYLAVGYRDDNDENSKRQKFRLPEIDVISKVF